MKKSIYAALGLLMAVVSCTQEPLSDSERIAGTYAEVSDCGVVTSLYRIAYGNIHTETSSTAVLFNADNGCICSEADVDDIDHCEYALLDNAREPVEYTYKNGIFTSSLYTGPLYVKDGVLEMDGKRLQKVKGTFPRSNIQPAHGWGIVYSPAWDEKNPIPMTWEGLTFLDNTYGWWHATFTVSDYTEFKVAYDKSWAVNRGPDPNETIYTGKPFSALQDGNNILIPAGKYEIYLSTDATKMIIQ